MRAILIIALLASAGCASQPGTDDTQRVVVVQPEHSGAFPPPEFTAKKQGEATVYCRQEVRLGTRFPDWVCYKEEHLRKMLERQKSIQDSLMRGQRACTGRCGGSGL